jgi:uncharacterized SAM-binding protein YcdF (DUF218 family)
METRELVQTLWDYHHLNHGLEKADVVLALGSSDIRTAERAAELFHGGYAPLIIFSGGSGRTTGAWKKSEAEIFTDRAVEMGVPRECIILESKSSNTGENIIFTKKLLEEKGLNPRTFILVQKPYMERRAYATFKKHFTDIEPIVTSPQISFDEYVSRGGRTLEEQINILTGDTQRIGIYAEKGFMIHQEMPEEVVFAYKELARRGFDKEMLQE